MRYISFALTTDAVIAQRKTVTRRLGWRTLTPGTLLQPAVKCQGLKKGEKIQPINGPIRVLKVTIEPLGAIVVDPGYGREEVAREGFAGMSACGFIALFCQANRGCHGGTAITRIEFEYVGAKMEAQ